MAPIPPPVGPPEPPTPDPSPSPDLGPVLAAVVALDAKLTAMQQVLEAQHQAILQAATAWPPAPVYRGTIRYLGPLVLTPDPPA